jgi:hypothetical protein
MQPLAASCQVLVWFFLGGNVYALRVPVDEVSFMYKYLLDGLSKKSAERW